MALSDASIRNAKPLTKPNKLGDSLGPFPLAQPSGAKLWRQKCRMYGREKKFGVGTYPHNAAPNLPPCGISIQERSSDGRT